MNGSFWMKKSTLESFDIKKLKMGIEKLNSYYHDSKLYCIFARL